MRRVKSWRDVHAGGARTDVDRRRVARRPTTSSAFSDSGSSSALTRIVVSARSVMLVARVRLVRLLLEAQRVDAGRQVRDAIEARRVGDHHLLALQARATSPSRPRRRRALGRRVDDRAGQNRGSLLREERSRAQPAGHGDDAGDPMQEILLEHCHEFLSTAEATITKGGTRRCGWSWARVGPKGSHTVQRTDPITTAKTAGGKTEPTRSGRDVQPANNRDQRT